MDIKGTESWLKSVDSMLTTLTNLLKRHWLILIILSLLTLGYFIITDEEVVEEDQIEYVEEQPVAESDEDLQTDEEIMDEEDAVEEDSVEVVE